MKRTFLFTAFIILVLALSFYFGFNIRWSRLFSPGDLSAAHQELDSTGDCNACHTRGKRLDTAKCLACHDEIKAKLEADSGIHSKNSRQCIFCHSEHHGCSYQIVHLDKESFDHSKTGWPLEGKHNLLKCQACHPEGSYLIPKNECVQCHKDAHNGENGTDCAECHNPNSFKET
ncbi:MAG: hypothetical protein AB1611_18055 [bacterium]